MTLFFDKEKCRISDDINGRILIIETDEPVYIEELGDKMLLHSQWDTDFGQTDEPYLTQAPKEYTL